ncbi:MAG: Clp protease ClpP [Muribaculaceae bacterium]|nr:Clp protease ClpP [Muribaculaceae bacterium]
MNYQLTIDYNIGFWGHSKQYVRNVLGAYKGKHVDVKISSLGGDLDHGLDIRQQFIDHGDVTAYLSGFVASAATIIAMGAQRIVMSKYAMFLVHKCSNFIDAWGNYNADQMQQLIDQLEANKKENDKIDVVLANMYAAKCGKKVSEILNILKEGRWLTADEALSYGFVDEISDLEGETKLNFTSDTERKFNAIGLSTIGLSVASDTAEQPRKSLIGKIVDSIFPAKEAKEEKKADEQPKSQPKQQSEMKTQKFSAVDDLLKLDVGLTADTEGYVSIKADQMETIDKRLASLSADVAKKDESLKANEKKIAELEEQVKNLKDGPGADTTEIEDDGEDTKVTSSEMYDKIKNLL